MWLWLMLVGIYTVTDFNNNIIYDSGVMPMPHFA